MEKQSSEKNLESYTNFVPVPLKTFVDDVDLCTLSAASWIEGASIKKITKK